MAKEIVDEILRRSADFRPAVIYFLGATDRGKTTIINQLANRLVEKSVAILDADIGQSGVLPLTLSLLRVQRPFQSFAELEIVKQDFVPSYNLMRNMDRYAGILEALVEEAKKWADYCLIDSTGFVRGPGVRLKRREIESSQPNLIVGLQRSDELRAILEGLEYPLLLFPVRPEVRKRSDSARRRNRNEKLSSYFRNSDVRQIPARLATLIPEDAEGRIVGLYGERFQGLGVVTGVRDNLLLVLTPVTGHLQRVEFSSLTFDLRAYSPNT